MKQSRRLISPRLLFVVILMVAGVFDASVANAAPDAPPYGECPAVGYSPSCQILLVVEPDGTVSVHGDPGVGDFDGADDTLVGIVNHWTSSVDAVTLSGEGSDLAGFDGDGMCGYIACSGVGPTGYEGPDNSFTTDPGSTDTVEVDFGSPGLAPGASSYFSLEGTLTDAVLTARRGPIMQSRGTVVAFGDSIAAGQGSGPSDGYPDNPNAYSGQLAGLLGWKSYNFAISGACAATSGKTGAYGTPKQCVKSIISDELPRAASLALKPDLVTVTIGANDVQFASCVPVVLGLVGRIVRSANDCTESALSGHLQAMETNLASALRQIRSLYGSVPIALTQYFNPMPAPVAPGESACAFMYPLWVANGYNSGGIKGAVSAIRTLDKGAAEEQQTIFRRASRITADINNALQHAARSANAQIVKLDFTGHDFCKDYGGRSDSWVLAPRFSVRAYRFGRYKYVPTGGSQLFAVDLIPAHECIDESHDSCYKTDPNIAESENLGVDTYSFYLAFRGNDFPHLTIPGHAAVAQAIAAQLHLGD